MNLKKNIEDYIHQSGIKDYQNYNLASMYHTI